MRDIHFYIDQAKNNHNLKSDLQFSEAMGFKPSMASMLRRGKTHLSDEKMVELAKLAGIKPEIALADLHYWRAPKGLKLTYKKMRDAVAMLSIMLIISIGSASSAFAGTGLTGLTITNTPLFIIT